MTVSDLITIQHRWGQARCRRLLQSVPMSENKTIGSMTDRQRRTVVALLRDASATPQPQQRALRPALAVVG
jgi:hypothetical protein